jgi:hypothetical protein
MRKTHDPIGMPIKAFMGAAVALAIGVGLLLPVPQKSEAAPHSQLQTLELS